MDPDIFIIALLMGASFIAGMIDAVAGGGGLITIPALLAAGVPPIQAIATNKLSSAFGTAGAVIAYARKGHINLRGFVLPPLASFVGAGIGAYLLTRIDPTFLAGFLPVLLIAMALYFIFAPRMGDADRHGRLAPMWLLGIAAAIGCYDGFFGPGTGSFFTTALIGLFGFGMIRAVARAKLLNLASNLAGLAVLMVGGHVLWLTGAAMAIGSIAGGQVGAHMTMRFGAGVARPLLIVMSLILTAKLLADPANPLTQMVLTAIG